MTDGQSRTPARGALLRVLPCGPPHAAPRAHPPLDGRRSSRAPAFPATARPRTTSTWLDLRSGNIARIARTLAACVRRAPRPRCREGSARSSASRRARPAGLPPRRELSCHVPCALALDATPGTQWSGRRQSRRYHSRPRAPAWCTRLARGPRLVAARRARCGPTVRWPSSPTFREPSATTRSRHRARARADVAPDVAQRRKSGAACRRRDRVQRFNLVAGRREPIGVRIARPTRALVRDPLSSTAALDTRGRKFRAQSPLTPVRPAPTPISRRFSIWVTPRALPTRCRQPVFRRTRATAVFAVHLSAIRHAGLDVSASGRHGEPTSRAHVDPRGASSATSKTLRPRACERIYRIRP